MPKYRILEYYSSYNVYVTEAKDKEEAEVKVYEGEAEEITDEVRPERNDVWYDIEEIKDDRS